MDHHKDIFDQLSTISEFKVEKDNTESFEQALLRSLYKFLKLSATNIPLLLKRLEGVMKTG